MTLPLGLDFGGWTTLRRAVRRDPALGRALEADPSAVARIDELSASTRDALAQRSVDEIVSALQPIRRYVVNDRNLDVDYELVAETEAHHGLSLDGTPYDVHMHEEASGQHVDVYDPYGSWAGRMTFVLGEGISLINTNGNSVFGIDKAALLSRSPRLPWFPDDVLQIMDCVDCFTCQRRTPLYALRTPRGRTDSPYRQVVRLQYRARWHS